MSKKVWYQIEVECIKYSCSFSVELGEKFIVAKVKSYGLAFIVAEQLQKIYNPEYFKINIK